VISLHSLKWKPVHEMDAMPRSLDLLWRAIEMITTPASIRLNIKMEGAYLRVYLDRYWNVRMEEDAYQLFFIHLEETWDWVDESTSKLAWRIAGGKLRLRARFGEKASAAAQGPRNGDRCRMFD
jgi:hypothetical protein